MTERITDRPLRFKPGTGPGPNPSGLCMCGCGEHTPIANRSRACRGDVAGRPVRYISGHYCNTLRRPPHAIILTVDIDASTGCWIWTGRINEGGYGAVSVGKSGKKAHRVSYERAKGPIPEGMHIHHLCHNKACINPDHLEAVSPRDHLAADGKLVLSLEKAADIRTRFSAGGISKHALAAEFGTDRKTIRQILRNTTWVA